MEEAWREADARTDAQRRREGNERERRRRLADRRAARSDEALAVLRQRAEAALAAEGVQRTRLGYEVLVKLKLDELLLEERGMGGHSGRDAAPDAMTLQVAGEEIDHEGV
jgi:hypothetical protein